MKVHSMGDGISDDVVHDVEGRPCLLLVADSREELVTALHGIGFRDEVTVARATPVQGNSEEP